MSTITFLSTEIDTKEIKCNLNEKMKDVCNRYAKEVNKNIKRLIFFSDGQKLIKKISVNEFYKSNPEKELFVVLIFCATFYIRVNKLNIIHFSL